MNTTSKVLVGILGAAAVGVVFGMLIAPEKGTDLRNNIKKTSDDWMSEVAQWMGKGKKFLTDLKDQATDEAEGLLADTEHGINGLKESARRKSQNN